MCGCICIYLLQSILAPFLFAALFAYLGDPLVDWLEARRFNRTSAVVIVFSVLFIITFCGILLLLPVLGDQLHYLQDRLPLMLDWVKEKGLPWLHLHCKEYNQVSQMFLILVEKV